MTKKNNELATKYNALLKMCKAIDLQRKRAVELLTREKKVVWEQTRDITQYRKNIDFYSKCLFEQEKQIKTQKIIIILLLVGLIVSLIMMI